LKNLQFKVVKKHYFNIFCYIITTIRHVLKNVYLIKLMYIVEPFCTEIVMLVVSIIVKNNCEYRIFGVKVVIYVCY